MPMATATRGRLTSAAITLHHPLDYYFTLFFHAKETEGLKPRTLNDHKNHYRYLQRWLTEKYPTLKLAELTADHVRQYVQHMLSVYPALKCFLQFLHDEGYLQTDLVLQKVKEDTIGAFDAASRLLLFPRRNRIPLIANPIAPASYPPTNPYA